MTNTTSAPPELRREFTFRSTFSLAFAFISPIIGLYTIFALALGAAGPAFWWGFAIVLGGQLLVALVLAELSSIWPLTGGLYQWTYRLAGPRLGWAAGWAYTCTLILLVTAQCYAAAPFLAGLLGMEAGAGGLVALGVVVLLLATAANAMGPRALKIFVAVSITAELLGSVVIGTILLLFHREQPLSALTEGVGGAAPTVAPMLAAIALVGWAFIGFESAGDIAEEVDEPECNVPKALVLSLVLVALVVMYAGLALILAIPDLGAAVAGDVADPIVSTLTTQLGGAIARPAFAVIVLAFIAGIVAVQAAVSRVLFALARAGELPGAASMGRLSGPSNLPLNAIAVSALAAGAFLLVAFDEDAYLMLISIATVGFYIAFAFPVIAALVARAGNRFTTGPWSLGRLGMAVNVAAAAWVAFEIVNISWPRDIGAAWYVEWGPILMVTAMVAAGVLARSAIRPASASVPAAAAPGEPSPS